MPPSPEPDHTLRRAWRIAQAGSLARLKLIEESLPPPATGEVQVEVEAIGVNFADVFACLGLYSATPKGSFVPGLECAGRVRRWGSGVTGWQEGDAVIVLTRFGGYT
ncbi:MAG: zinc-binding dehydrogenase, partial [Gammaproteobacteria bacterium]|nr:zinc-binding dehydrogenase [Gammaproteobacteria bacterium]